EATEADTRGGQYRVGEPRELGLVANPGTPHPDVVFDQDVDARAQATGRGAQLSQVGQIIDGDHQGALAGQPCCSGDLLTPHDLVGDEDVVDPAPDHHRRLGDRRGAHAVRTAEAQLEPGRVDALVDLDVRTQPYRTGLEKIAHALEIPLHDLEVDDDAGSRELGNRPTNISEIWLDARSCLRGERPSRSREHHDATNGVEVTTCTNNSLGVYAYHLGHGMSTGGRCAGFATRGGGFGCPENRRTGGGS